LTYQNKEFEKILTTIFDRTMNEDDKQYQVDVADIIEDHNYQCIQI